MSLLFSQVNGWIRVLFRQPQQSFNQADIPPLIIHKKTDLVMKADKVLSKQDVLVLLDIIESSLRCETKDDFLKVFRSFREMIGMEYIFCSQVNIDKIIQGEKFENNDINLSAPEEFLKIYKKKNLFVFDHVLSDFLKTFKIQRWKDVFKKHGPDVWGDLLNTSADFGLNDGFVYGVRITKGLNANCFSISDKKVKNSQRKKEIIKHLIPHLSEAFNKVVKTNLNGSYNITEKEKEILNWLKEGKSSWEISVILNRSERVVNFHITNIITKLDATNRTHAVVKAIHDNIIQI